MSTDNPPELADPPLPPSTSSDAADIRRQVEQEQALIDAQRKVATLEQEVEKVKAEKETADKAREDTTSIVNQLRTQSSSLQSSHHEISSKLSVSETRFETSKREKLELLEEATRLQERTKRANDELYTLRGKQTEASHKIAHLDVEVSELKMKESTAKFNEERSVAALQHARNEILNLGKAIADVEERFGKYRVDKQSEVQQIQVDNDSLKSRLDSAEYTHRSLQSAFDAQSRRLADAHSNIATLTSAAASQKASFRIELNRLTEEVRLLEKRADDSRAAVADREAELERLVESQSEKEKLWEERWKKEERSRRDAEKRSDDLKTVVERLALANGEGASISAAASVAAGQKQSGKTYTEFYRDYVIQEGKLRASELEVDNLQQLLDEITQDIEERKYDLESQAAEKDRAVERANALAAELASAQTSRDSYEARVKALTAESAHYTEELTELRSTSDDLSRQVQTLLRQIAIKDDPSLANHSLDNQTPVKEGDVITDRFVEFKSIRQLQEQNQRLLKVSRGLMAKLDQREIRRAAANGDDLDTGATLDQATETVTKLHAQLLEAQKKINEAQRERDFFSKLLARGDGLKFGQTVSGHGTIEDGEGIHQQSMTTLQAELDIVKREMDLEISKAKEQVAAKDQAVGVAEVEKAKAEAQISILQEQQRMLNETNSVQKAEYRQLETTYAQATNALAQSQAELRSARQDVETHRAAADRARNEAANLRAEKEQWKSHESRLESNLRTVNEERAKLQHLIDSLQTVSREGEQTRAEERRRLEQREENLQKDCAALRSDVEKAREATRAAEKRIEESDARLESATASVKAEKEAAEALAKSRQEEIEKISKTSEDRKSIGLNWKRRTDILNEDKAALQKQLAEEVEGKKKSLEELNVKIEVLNKELEEVRGKVVEAEKKVAEAEKTVQARDLAVQKLQADVAKGNTSVSTDTAALSAVEAERDALKTKVEQIQKELEAAKTSSTSTTPAAASAVTDEERAKWEVERASEKATADKRYEEGVLRVNRVNGGLKTRVDALQADKATLESQIATLRTELESLRNSQNTQTAASTEAGEIVPPSQEVIDSAVRTAIATREAELTAEHQAALAASSSGPTTVKIETVVDQAAIQSAVSAKEKELKETFEKQLAEAVAAAKSAASSTTSIAPASDPAAEAALKTQIEELEKKIKTLERQAKTTEISRKTLERQKIEAEAKAIKLEAAANASNAGSNPTTPLVAITPSTAVTPTITPVAKTAVPSAVVKPAEAGPSTSAPAVAGGQAAPARGGIRGATRGRGVVRGAGATRGAPGNRASILSTVNAQLSSSTTESPASPTGTKRPLPEDESGGGEVQSDILARIQSASGDGSPSARGRQIKRPRGAGPVRGGRGGGPRRGSGPGDGAAGGSAGGESSGGGNAGSAA